MPGRPRAVAAGGPQRRAARQDSVSSTRLPTTTSACPGSPPLARRIDPDGAHARRPAPGDVGRQAVADHRRFRGPAPEALEGHLEDRGVGLAHHDGPRPARHRDGLRQRAAAGVELAGRDREAGVEIHREEGRAGRHGARRRAQPREVERGVVTHGDRPRFPPVVEADHPVAGRLQHVLHLAGAEREDRRGTHASPDGLAEQIEGGQHVSRIRRDPQAREACRRAAPRARASCSSRRPRRAPPPRRAATRSRAPGRSVAPAQMHPSRSKPKPRRADSSIGVRPPRAAEGCRAPGSGRPGPC